MSLIATFFLLCHKAVQLVEHFGSLIDSHDVDIQSVHSCQDTKGLVTSTLVIRQNVAVQPTNSPELDQLDQDKINSIRTRSIGSGQDQLDQEREKGHRKAHPKSWQLAGLPESEHPQHLVVLLCLPHIHWPGKQHCCCSLSNAYSVLLTAACETVLYYRRSSHKINLLLQ